MSPAGAGGFGGMTEAETAIDVLVQHLKVFLLFAVLMRHLQRFTVRTCHAWAKVPAHHAAVCVANNVLQTGAAEGLAFLSGVAIAGRVVSLREVATPFVLIVLFRQLLHPGLEWLLSYTADIGTAHLWFVLMVGVLIILGCLLHGHRAGQSEAKRRLAVGYQGGSPLTRLP